MLCVVVPFLLQLFLFGFVLFGNRTFTEALLTLVFGTETMGNHLEAYKVVRFIFLFFWTIVGISVLINLAKMTIKSLIML